MDDTTSPEEAPDFDTPVALDKNGEPDPKAQEKWQPRRGSDPAAPKLVAARVQRIALLMASGEWAGYPTAFALAAEWGLKVSTVRQYAVHAGNLIDLMISSDETLKSRLLSTLETIVARAMNPVGKDGKPTGKPQFREAIEAIKVMAGLTGIDKTYEANKANTAAIVGLTETLAAAKAAAEANAKADDDDGGSG